MSSIEGTMPVKPSEPANNVRVVPLIAVLIAGAFVALLNETLLNVAIAPIMHALGVDASTAQWLTTGYLLIVAILIPVSAFLLQSFTTRQLYITSMTLFGIGTALAGFAVSFSMLLVGRFIQALGTGILIPLLTNVILVLIPPERRGRVMGLLGLVFMFAPALGPTLSGIIVDALSWRWLFYVVLPVAIASIFYGVFALKNVGEPSRPKLDWFSVVLSTIGFGGVVFAFSSAGEGGWTEREVIVSIVAGLIALAIFVYRQLKLENPMLDLRALKYPMFSLALVLMMIVFMTMFAMMIVMPIYLLNVLAFSAVTVGLVMLPGGVVNGAISPIMGYLFDKFGPRWLLLPGVGLLSITAFSFTRIGEVTSPAIVAVLYIMLMVGVAMIMMPAQTNGLNELPPELYPHGAAIVNTLLQVAGAIGIALFVTIMSLGERNYLSGIADPSPADEIAALSAGVHLSFGFGFGFALIAVVLALFVKRVHVANSDSKDGSTNGENSTQ